MWSLEDHTWKKFCGDWAKKGVFSKQGPRESSWLEIDARRCWCLWDLLKCLWFLTRVKVFLLCSTAALPSFGKSLASSVSNTFSFCLVQSGLLAFCCLYAFCCISFVLVSRACSKGHGGKSIRKPCLTLNIKAIIVAADQGLLGHIEFRSSAASAGAACVVWGQLGLWGRVDTLSPSPVYLLAPATSPSLPAVPLFVFPTECN